MQINSPSTTHALASLETLVNAQVCTREQALDTEQKSLNKHPDNASLSSNVAPVGYLVDEHHIDAEQIAATLATQFYCDRWSPELEVNRPLIQHYQDIIEHAHVLPVQQQGPNVTLAVVDPTDQQGLQKIGQAMQANIHPIVINYQQLADVLLAEFNLKLASHRQHQHSPQLAAVNDGNHEQKIVELVDEYLEQGVQKGASDIHFEPLNDVLRVRMRLDGLLTTMDELPLSLARAMITRLKVLSRLDIAERRLPQDGRLLWHNSQPATLAQDIDMRISVCPVLHGEKAVIRILANAASRLSMSQLGMAPEQLQYYQAACAKAQGLILVTGPTGSGKSVTQYAALTELNEQHRNISTAEDPVEILLDGVNQVHVNPRIGLTFAAAMRSFLRQDPDVIMIGEIRDTDTAEMAVKAAQTGHLVFSTLHTNDAPQSLIRLENIGVAPYNIAASVSLIIAQRLARKLCQHCKQPDHRPLNIWPENYHTLENAERYQANPQGCRHCDAGYRGRTGVFQVLPISEAMRELMLHNHTSQSIARLAAEENVGDLMSHGLTLIKQGITSMDEVQRVLNH